MHLLFRLKRITFALGNFAHFVYHKCLGKCKWVEWGAAFWCSLYLSFLFRHTMKLDGHEALMNSPFQKSMPFTSESAWLVDSTEPWLPSGASSAFAALSGGGWHLWTVMLASALQTAIPVPCLLPWIRKALTHCSPWWPASSRAWF